MILVTFVQANFGSFADPKRQLYLAVIAVFDSWDSPRANKYRSINQIKGLKGTAVNVQCMVFGNMGDTSGTGVLFTRNPSTGEKQLYGEFLVNAQVLYVFFSLFYVGPCNCCYLSSCAFFLVNLMRCSNMHLFELEIGWVICHN